MNKTLIEEFYKDRMLLRSDWFRRLDDDIFMQKEYDIFNHFYLGKMSDNIEKSNITECKIRKVWREYKIYAYEKHNGINFYDIIKTDILVPFKQTIPYGCSIYCLANLLNNESVLIEYLPQFEHKGINFIDESKILSKISKDNDFDGEYYLLPMVTIQNYYFSDEPNINYFEIYDSMILDNSDRNNPHYMVFFVGVTMGTMSHKILIIKKLFVDEYYVVDSLKDTISKMNYELLNVAYDIFCYSIINENRLKDKEFALINENIIKHLL